MVIINDIQKFITIKNNNIELINNIPLTDKPIKIISFLGNARTGKSSLMNCYLSNKLNFNIKKFNTANKLNSHCTTGIDILVIEDLSYNIILLDIQGLELQDGRDDCKLMTFVYLISNMIIFCPKTILDNSVLSSLSSLTSILTHVNIDINIKPLLLFRPRDINEDAEFDPSENLNNMLEEIDDQFKEVRESIKKLFNPILSRPTFSLDKKELKMLTSNTFIEFMTNTTNGFKDICYYINENIDMINSYDSKIINKNITDIISNINQNTKIDFNIFNITKREAEVSIKEFICDCIDKTQYDVAIHTDGTQIQYDKYIQTRIDYMTLILDDFDKKFEKTAPNIKKLKRDEIKTIFLKHITEAQHNATTISTEQLTNIYDQKIKTYKKTIDIDVRSNKDIDLSWINKELNEYIKDTPYLESIKKIFLTRIDKQFKEFILIGFFGGKDK